MKKTLIALMAVASCAMGVTLKDAIGSLDSTTTALTFNAETSSSYYMTVVLNGATLTKFESNTVINDTLASLTLNTTNAGLAVGTSMSNSKVKGSGYVAGTNLGNGNGTYWTNDSMEKTSAIEGIAEAEYVAITFGVVGTKEKMDAIISTFNADGVLLGSSSYVELQYVANKVGANAVLTGAAIDTTYISNGYVFAGAYDQATLLAANKAAITALVPSTPAVPEPTTATLSLLALAGLAARRRRH